jgi:hypothetical protein
MLLRRKGSDMGRRSREHRERREKRARDARRDPAKGPVAGQEGSAKAAGLEEELNLLAGGDAFLWTSERCPAPDRETYLEDILAFESVGSKDSLFQGLQERGLCLPPPQTLNEQQSAEKVTEILRALERLRVYLIGFMNMSARECYTVLWNQTLWEGCYVEKRNPEAVTIIDVSHSLAREDMLQFLEELAKSESVH